eukprot:jgi/Tetstr1/461676/TSEL_006776.t1
MASRASAPTCTRAWAEPMRTSMEPTPSERTRIGSPVFAPSSCAAGPSLWSAKTVPQTKKAAVREWHRPARQRLTHKRQKASAPPSAASAAPAARALADYRRFRRRALRDVPAASSTASIW